MNKSDSCFECDKSRVCKVYADFKKTVEKNQDFVGQSHSFETLFHAIAIRCCCYKRIKEQENEI